MCTISKPKSILEFVIAGSAPIILFENQIAIASMSLARGTLQFSTDVEEFAKTGFKKIVNNILSGQQYYAVSSRITIAISKKLCI